jgi:hypothetical protein
VFGVYCCYRQKFSLSCQSFIYMKTSINYKLNF